MASPRMASIVIRRTEERFSDVKTAEGEYLQTWFEYLPDEVLKGTAPAGTVPLILALHGSGDDPRVFVDENRPARPGRLRAVCHGRAGTPIPRLFEAGRQRVEGILPDILPRFVKHILKTYPALDPSRVYVTGYSMGGAATLGPSTAIRLYSPPQSPWPPPGYTGTPEQVAQFEKAHMPIMFTTSAFDLPGAFNQAAGPLRPAIRPRLNLFLGYNGMKKIDAFDFKTYPINGFKADSMERVKLNNEYENTSWYLNDADGVPMVVP